jgi:hypothetical protein
MTERGYRLARNPIVINVGLLGPVDLNPQAYFKKFSDVANVTRLDLPALDIDGDTPPQAAFELKRQGQPAGRSQLMLLQTPHGWYALGMDCPAQLFQEHRATFANIAGSLAVPHAPPAIAPPNAAAMAKATASDKPAPPRYVAKAMEFSAVEPAGWKRQTLEDGHALRWMTPDGTSMIQVSAEPVEDSMDPATYAKAWEKVAIDGPANTDGLKRVADTVGKVNGWPVYVAVYAGEKIALKNVYLTGPKQRMFVISGFFATDVVRDGAVVFDAFVAHFQPTGGKPPATADKAGSPGPLRAKDGSFGLTVPQQMHARRPIGNTVILVGNADSPLEFMQVMVQSQGRVGGTDALDKAIAEYRQEVLRVRPKAEISGTETFSAAHSDLKGQQFTARYLADQQRIAQRVIVLRDMDDRFYVIVAMAPREVFEKNAKVITALVDSLSVPGAEE